MGLPGVPLTAEQKAEILRLEALGENATAIGLAIGRARQSVDYFLRRHHKRILGIGRVGAEPSHVGLKPDDPGEHSLDYQLASRGWIIAQDKAFVRAMMRAHPELLLRESDRQGAVKDAGLAERNAHQGARQ